MITACLAAIGAMSASFIAAAQTAPPSPFPAAGAYTTIGYDRSDELKLTGEVVKIDLTPSARILWIVPKQVLKQGFRVQPGTDANGAGQIWRIDATDLKSLSGGDLATLAAGATVTIKGLNSKDKTCRPSCRMIAKEAQLK